MRPIAELTTNRCRALRGVFCDIDDTLPTEGRIPAAAFTALWRAHDAGLVAVPATGRPACRFSHHSRT